MSWNWGPRVLDVKLLALQSQLMDVERVCFSRGSVLKIRLICLLYTYH